MGAVRLQAAVCAVDTIDLKAFALPAYDGDLEAASMPEACLRLKAALDRAQAGVILSPRLDGGNRGLWSLRVPLEMSSALVYPDMFSLASATDAFESGTRKDPAMQKRLDDLVTAFVDFARRNVLLH